MAQRDDDRDRQDDQDDGGRRGRGQQRREPPRLTVREPVFGEVRARGDGTFECGITVLVLVGDHPPKETVNYQYLVNGEPQGGWQLIDGQGRASARLILSAGRPHVAISLNWIHGPMLVDIRDVDDLPGSHVARENPATFFTDLIRRWRRRPQDK